MQRPLQQLRATLAGSLLEVALTVALGVARSFAETIRDGFPPIELQSFRTIKSNRGLASKGFYFSSRGQINKYAKIESQ